MNQFIDTSKPVILIDQEKHQEAMQNRWSAGYDYAYEEIALYIDEDLYFVDDMETYYDEPGENHASETKKHAEKIMRALGRYKRVSDPSASSS